MRKIILTDGSIVFKLTSMTIPMIGGMFALSAFNLADTYFVSKLGTDELAAMSFTFPVVMILSFIALGIGMGVSSCVSRAIGQGNQHKVKRLTTDGLFLGVVITSFLAVLGLIFLNPIFRLLGADGHILELVNKYMRIWFSSVAVIFIPMISNNAIRATGNTVIPGIIMISASIFNIILDPILIFGYFGIPAMGIQGAVIATVISRAFGMIASILILTFYCQYLDYRVPSYRELMESWKDILTISIPAAFTNSLKPLADGIVTRMVAAFGTAAVAGTGAGTKVLMFTFMVPMALGSTLVPFIGQNHGAKKIQRIRNAWIGSSWTVVVYSIFWLLIILLSGNSFTSLFSKNPEVIKAMKAYLIFLLVGSGLQHIAVHSGFALNAMGLPIHATLLSVFRIFFLIIPLSFLGKYFFGLYGIYGGLACANIIAGAAGLLIIKLRLDKEEKLLENKG